MIPHILGSINHLTLASQTHDNSWSWSLTLDFCQISFIYEFKIGYLSRLRLFISVCYKESWGVAIHARVQRSMLFPTDRLIID